MNVVRCDRCGQERREGPVQPRVNMHLVTLSEPNSPADVAANFDLCSSCAVELRHWMDRR